VTNLGNPYTDEKISDNEFIRTFDKNIMPEELLWHFDERDREVTPINENDWLFQFDNQLPIFLHDKIFIRKDEYHRLIKGTTHLKLLIKEL
jgi:hypothetical protein